MADAWRSYRSSVNVQQPLPDLGRAAWLDALAYAPDDYRAAHGLSPVNDATRGAAYGTIQDESPYIDAARDVFGQGRAVKIDAFDDLPKLGAPSFMQRNDQAVLANQVGGMLNGQTPPRDTYADMLAAAMGPRLPFLGQR